MERETGLEPATICLGSRDSTTELFPLSRTKIHAIRAKVNGLLFLWALGR